MTRRLATASWNCPWTSWLTVTWRSNAFSEGVGDRVVHGNVDRRCPRSQQPAPSGQSPAPSEQRPRPATDPATPGERTTAPAENPPRPAAPRPAPPPRRRGPAARGESISVDLQAIAVADDRHPQRDDPDRRRAGDRARIDPAAGRQDRRRRARPSTRPPTRSSSTPTGKWVTPGVIDTHSHLGVYAAPGIESLQDGNEMTSPNTAEVSAEHSIWPQDPQFDLALAGGVTTMQILPGSANLFGGRSVTVKNVPSRTADRDEVSRRAVRTEDGVRREPEARLRQPQQRAATRMGNVAGYRQAWQAAAEYRDSMASAGETAGSDPAKRPDREPAARDARRACSTARSCVQNHCYRADEMATMIDISPRSSATRSRRSTTRSRPTRSATCSPRTTSAPACGPTGGASSSRPTTASARTSRSCTRPAAAPSSTPTMPTASSG